MVTFLPSRGKVDGSNIDIIRYTEASSNINLYNSNDVRCLVERLFFHPHDVGGLGLGTLCSLMTPFPFHWYEIQFHRQLINTSHDPSSQSCLAAIL